MVSRTIKINHYTTVDQTVSILRRRPKKDAQRIRFRIVFLTENGLPAVLKTFTTRSPYQVRRLAAFGRFVSSEDSKLTDMYTYHRRDVYNQNQVGPIGLPRSYDLIRATGEYPSPNQRRQSKLRLERYQGRKYLSRGNINYIELLRRNLFNCKGLDGCETARSWNSDRCVYCMGDDMAAVNRVLELIHALDNFYQYGCIACRDTGSPTCGHDEENN